MEKREVQDDGVSRLGYEVRGEKGEEGSVLLEKGEGIIICCTKGSSFRIWGSLKAYKIKDLH